MKKLIDGIIDFRKSLTEQKRMGFKSLALGQSPDCLFIGCSDSRVAPDHFASTNPGDLFVLRNVGNIIPPASTVVESSPIAALEFAVKTLNVTDIVVCGHSECGAMQAIHNGIENLSCPHLKKWLEFGDEALKKVVKDGPIHPELKPWNQISQMNVLVQMRHIASYPFIQERIKDKRLKIHGWWFDISRADVYCYDPNKKNYALIDEFENIP